MSAEQAIKKCREYSAILSTIAENLDNLIDVINDDVDCGTYNGEIIVDNFADYENDILDVICNMRNDTNTIKESWFK
jgi:hypothetical protein